MNSRMASVAKSGWKSVFQRRAQLGNQGWLTFAARLVTTMVTPKPSLSVTASSAIVACARRKCFFFSEQQFRGGSRGSKAPENMKRLKAPKVVVSAPV